MARSSNSQQTQGVPTYSRTVNKAGAGLILSGTSGETVIITDIMSSAVTTLSTDSGGGGTIIAYVPAGGTNLNQAIRVPTGVDLYTSAGVNITINYYIIR